MNNASSGKKRVLVISGEPLVLAEIKMTLMHHFDISIAATGAAALAALERYKAVIVVIYMGESRNKALSDFRAIAEFVTDKGIPTVFLAENDNKDDEIAAFEAGAADYTVRRHGSAEALIRRINLRINESEYKRVKQSSGALRDVSGCPEKILAGKTILIADDVELNRDIVASMLSDIENLTLEFAVDGKKAVEKFAKTPARYSLIFMDVQMPEMNGLEATRAIRNLNCENAGEVPIIALTANIREDEISQCFEAGMNGFIQKPMAYDKLLNIAAEYCI